VRGGDHPDLDGGSPERERDPRLEGLPEDLQSAMQQAQDDPDYIPPLVKEELRPRAARLYKLLEQLLFRGFLSSEWACARGRVRVRLKTLNLAEFELAKEMAPAFLSSWERAAHVKATAALAKDAQERAQLAFSLYRVDGVNFLGGGVQSREDAVLQFRPLFDVLGPHEVRAALRSVLVLAKLSSVVSRALVPYTYGPDSRRRWGSLPPGTPLCLDSLTGVTGTSGLGLNSAQDAWSWINRLTDQFEEQQRAYDLTKFQAGVHAGKEVRKLDANDRRAHRERLRREQLIWAFADMDAWDPDAAPSETIMIEESGGDLLKQMERAITGERDHHDAVVQAHEGRLRDQLMKKVQQRDEFMYQLQQERAAELELENLDPELLVRSGGSLLVVVTDEEGDRRAKEIAQSRWDRAIEEGGVERSDDKAAARAQARELENLEERLALAERHHLIGQAPVNHGPPPSPKKP
jgi:hypothetical protein